MDFSLQSLCCQGATEALGSGKADLKQCEPHRAAPFSGDAFPPESGPVLQRDHIVLCKYNSKKISEVHLTWVLPSGPAPELCVSCSSSVFTFPACPFPCTIPVVFLPWLLHLWLLFVYILCVYIKARVCDRAEHEHTLQICGVTFIAQPTCNPRWIRFFFLQE